MCGRGSLPATLTQFLGNSGVLLFIHKAEADVLIIEIFQDLGGKLRQTAREKTEEGANVRSEARGPIPPRPLTSRPVCVPPTTTVMRLISGPQKRWIAASHFLSRSETEANN